MKELAKRRCTRKNKLEREGRKRDKKLKWKNRIRTQV